MAGSALGALMARLLARPDRDGQSPALEAQAALLVADAAPEGSGRRERGLPAPRDLMDEVVAQKVLHGWLANRHQVLVPLTFRLSRLEAADVALIVRFMAAVLLAGSRGDAAAVAQAEAWLRGVGTNEAGLAAFREALVTPEALSTLLAGLAERGLQAYGYAAAVAAADTRDPSGHLLANYVAARLDVPADAVRSIDRRYRR